VYSDLQGRSICLILPLDFAAPDAPAHLGLAGLLHSSQHLKDNIEGRILSLMCQAGFLYPEKVMDKSMLFGLLRLGYFQASMNST
jgi:hypothetical protein